MAAKRPRRDLSHISQPLRRYAVATHELSANPANVRYHPEINLHQIGSSLRRFGQQSPLIVDADGVVQKGNGTLAAARQLGWTHIAAIRTDLTGVELAAYGIADNRVGETSEWDEEGLARLLQAIQAEDGDAAAATGFSDEEIAELVGGLDPGFEPTDGDDQGDLDQKKPITCPKCGHEFVS